MLAILASAAVAFTIAVTLRALDAPSAVVLATSQIGLWTPMVGALLYTSKRFGTGSLRADYGFEWKGLDVLRGLGVWFAGLIAVGLVLQLVPESVRKEGAGNTEIARHFRGDTPGIVVVLLIGIAGAPIIEELFFRGLLLRSLMDKLPRGVAVVEQALVFGLLHASPVRGVSNLNVIVATATLGLVFGAAAVRFGRLGPGMTAHATQNTLALLVVVLTR